MAVGDLVKKTKVVPFIKTTAGWMPIKKSTAFTLNMNPQTRTYDFISDDEPSTEISSYQPTLAQSLTMFKGEPDYQEIFDMLFARSSGADAHREALIVFYQEKLTSTDSGDTNEYFRAWKCDGVITVSQMDTVNESIDFDLALNRPVNGAVFIDEGVVSFVEGTSTGSKFTPKNASGVTSVTVYPATADVKQGTEETFQAIVKGIGVYASTVTWSLVDGTATVHSGTKIVNGVLTADDDQQAGLIKVIATSTEDGTKKGEAVVTIDV